MSFTLSASKPNNVPFNSTLIAWIAIFFQFPSFYYSILSLRIRICCGKFNAQSQCNREQQEKNHKGRYISISMQQPCIFYDDKISKYKKRNKIINSICSMLIQSSSSQYEAQLSFAIFRLCEKKKTCCIVVQFKLIKTKYWKTKSWPLHHHHAIEQRKKLTNFHSRITRKTRHSPYTTIENKMCTKCAQEMRELQ